ncbi:KGG domain-containing protein [Staphylococcus gallinarum]
MGQKGGEKTSQEHDKEFYQDIGQKGGEKRAQNNNENE